MSVECLSPARIGLEADLVVLLVDSRRCTRCTSTPSALSRLKKLSLTYLSLRLPTGFEFENNGGTISLLLYLVRRSTAVFRTAVLSRIRNKSRRARSLSVASLGSSYIYIAPRVRSYLR